MALMAIHDGYRDAPIVRQRLVAFQATIDLMNRFPHRTRIHPGVHIIHGFGAGHRLAQPTLPEPGGTSHLQSVEASQPLSKVIFWSIQSVLSPEPYVKMEIAPGKEFRWSINYAFYEL